MLDHFFISSQDGALYDTRNSDWSRKPLRANYCRTHTKIQTVADYKATIRAGAFAWPGGYPLFFLCADDGALCFLCACREAREIINALRHKSNTGWRIVATEINWENNELCCDHCGTQIESAYGA